ncbi:MAG: NAD(P)H-dependent oxidoreductase [Candidatus Peribacteraceae bacterium]
MQNTPANGVRVAIIVAGTNEPSNADFLADSFAEGARSVPGVVIEKIRLKDLRMDHFILRHYEPLTHDADDFPKVREMILRADAVVLASPIWNFSVPSHLKNLIDRMGAFGLDETHSIGTLNSKPFFLLFTGGSPAVAWPLLKRTTSHLPRAIQYFGGAVLGIHYEGRCTKGRGIFGLVVNQRLRSIAAVRAKGNAFARSILECQRTGQLPLQHRTTQKCIRLAQKLKRGLGL